jgi:glycosyltransferase involved in cell wall biosynthesis
MFVHEAIECVQSQTFTDWELVISDNNSSDETVSICNDFASKDARIQVHKCDRNQGVAPNFNRVFELSRGKYFKWITHDDLFGPEFLQQCINELEIDETAVLVFPRVEHIDASRKIVRAQQGHDLSIIDQSPGRRIAKFMQHAVQSTDIYWSLYGLMRRQAAADTRIMGFYSGMDQVFLLELALRGNLRQIQTERFLRREHPGASTLRRNWTARERALFAYADDKRILVFPYFRMLFESITAVKNSAIPALDKSQCIMAILGKCAKEWRYFLQELLESPVDALTKK